jgi:hypothetical protein
MSFAAPLWLLALLPLLAVAFLVLRHPNLIKAGLPGAWSKVVHPQMQPLLAARVVGQSSGLVPVCLAVAALLVLALARPSLGWSSVTDFENLMARAILLDMSGAADVSAQKLVVADLLAAAPDIPTTLIAVASDGYDVVPLTRDAAFLNRYLQVLGPDVMPEGGRALHLGVLHAEAVLDRAGIITRQLVLVTGGEPALGLPDLPASGRHGALIPIGATHDGWDLQARSLGLDLVDENRARDLAQDLRRRADKALHDVPQNGRMRLGPYLLALAACCWLFLFRRGMYQ